MLYQLDHAQKVFYQNFFPSKYFTNSHRGLIRYLFFFSELIKISACSLQTIIIYLWMTQVAFLPHTDLNTFNIITTLFHILGINCATNTTFATSIRAMFVKRWVGTSKVEELSTKAFMRRISPRASSTTTRWSSPTPSLQTLMSKSSSPSKIHCQDR